MVEAMVADVKYRGRLFVGRPEIADACSQYFAAGGMLDGRMTWVFLFALSNRSSSSASVAKSAKQTRRRCKHRIVK
jgi:hypothetical protein